MKKNILLFIIIVNGFMVDLSSDIFSPALPLIQHEFSTSVFFAESLIGLNVIWLGISGIFYGIFSDWYGRKKIAVIGVLIFIVGLVLCVKANTIFKFILGRNIQGMGSGFAIAIGLAILRDLFQGKDYIKATSMVGAFLMCVPLIAPALGSLLIHYYNWRATFYIILVMAIFSLIFMTFFFPTHTPHNKKPKSYILWKQTKDLLKNRFYILYILVNASATAGIWILINFMPYILQIQFDKTVTEYGISISIALLSGVIGALANTKLINYLSGKIILKLAISLAALAAIIIFSANYFNPHAIIALVGMSTYFFAIAFIFPITSDLAFESIDESMMGFAASILTLIEMTVSGVMLLLVGKISHFSQNYTMLVGGSILIAIMTGYFLLRVASYIKRPVLHG